MFPANKNLTQFIFKSFQMRKTCFFENQENEFVIFFEERNLTQIEMNAYQRTQSLIPITKAFNDNDGNCIQVWFDAKNGLAAAMIDKKNGFHAFAKDKIYNWLTNTLLQNEVQNLLALNNSENFVAIYSNGKVFVWPKMEGAGKNDFKIVRFYNPFAGKTLDEIQEMFLNKKNKKGEYV